VRIPFWLLLAACSSTPGANDASDGGSASDLQKLCEAETRAAAVEAFPFATKQQTINAWLERELQDEKIRSLYYDTLLQTPVHMQGDLLRKEASEAGLDACPFAALLDFLADLPRKGLTTDDCIARCVERHGLPAGHQTPCRRGCGAD
jgi:hypothetical protein